MGLNRKESKAMARERIYFKNQQELEIMRNNGRVLAELFERYKEIIAPA